SAGTVTGAAERQAGHPCDHRASPLDVLRQADVNATCDGDRIRIDGSRIRDGGYRAVDIETAPYPGLPTDIQPPTCVLLTQAEGRSTVHEAIFVDRLVWQTELNVMG